MRNHPQCLLYECCHNKWILQVLVGLQDVFEVMDDDFSKFSLTPSVIFKVDVPVLIEKNWYNGQVYVGVKDTIFQPSSPARHCMELESVLQNYSKRPMLCLYTDGE